MVHDASAERGRTMPTRPLRRRRAPTALVRLTFILPLILYLVIFYGYPVFYSIQISLEKYDLKAEITGVAAFAGLSNYIAAFQDPTFKISALHTLLFTALSF